MSSSCRKLYVALGAAGALLGLGARSAYADNWEFLPRIEGGGTYNDNYRLADTSAGKVDVYGPYIDAQVAADLLSPTSKLQIVPEVHSNYFPTDAADQSTDEYLTIDGDHKGLRSELKGIAQYSNETVIFSELPPATFPGVALGQVVGGATGLVTYQNREQLERVVPEYTYDVTQRTHLDVQAEYDHASFSHAVVRQYGFQNYTGRIGMLFDVTPRSELSVSAVGSRFEPQVGAKTNRYGADLEWDFRNSQIMHMYLRLGANRVEAQAPQGTVSSNGITGGAGVEWDYQITQVVLDVLRSLTPSDAGSEIVNDEVRFRVLHAFYPLFSGFFGARAVRVRGASGKPGLAIQREDYATAEVGCDYQLSLSFRIEATYDLTWQRFQRVPSAESNAVGLAFIYQPLSRYEPLPEFTGIPREP